MRHKGTEAFPSGKRFRMDHNADKFSVRCDERVDLFRESLEIRSLKRAFGGNEKNTTVSQQFKSDHLSTHSLSSGCNPPWTTACRAKTGRFDATFLDPHSLTIALGCDYSQARAQLKPAMGFHFHFKPVLVDSKDCGHQAAPQNSWSDLLKSIRIQQSPFGTNSAMRPCMGIFSRMRDPL